MNFFTCLRLFATLVGYLTLTFYLLGVLDVGDFVFSFVMTTSRSHP